MYDNSLQIHTLTDSDALTPLGRTLMRGGAAIDGSSLTLETKLVNTAGEIVHDWTTTGASWSSAAAGKAQYDWQSADLAAFQAAADGDAFWFWLRVKVTGASPAEYDTFPHDDRKLKIVVRKAK
jgi:hypothetical protein